MESFYRKKYTIYDPDTKMFIGKETKGGLFISDTNWVSDLTHARTYVAVDDPILDLWKALTCSNEFVREKKTHSNAFIVEVHIRHEFEPVSVQINTSEEYQKHRERYDALLPQYLKDADAMKNKDWEAFKISRRFLRDVMGEEVER